MSTGGGGKQHTKAERNHELELARLRSRERINLYDKVFKVVRQALGGAVLVGIAYYMYRSVDSMAGKSTEFNAFISAVTDFKVDQWAAYIIAGIGGGGWVIERRLRRKTIKEHAGQIKELEKRGAPDRISSGLRPDGRPKQKDLEDA